MNLSSLTFFTAKINSVFSWYIRQCYFHLVYYFKDTFWRSTSLMKCTAHLAYLTVLFQCHKHKPCTATLTCLVLHRLCWVENVINSGSKPHGHCCDLWASSLWQEVAVDRGQVEAMLDNTWTPAHKQPLFIKKGKRILPFWYCSHSWMFSRWCNWLNYSYFVSTWNISELFTPLTPKQDRLWTSFVFNTQSYICLCPSFSISPTQCWQSSTQLLGGFWVDLALPHSPPYYLSLSHLLQSLLQPDFQCSGKQGWIWRLGPLKVHQVTLGWMAGDQGLSPWQQAWASVQGGLQRSKEIPARPTQVPEQAAHPKSEKLLLKPNESFCPRRADNVQSGTS